MKAVVTDANSNRVPGAVVAFSATNGATVAIVSVTTDANGEATTTLTNTTAGASTVTAKINNVSQMVDTTFIPDSSTATIANGALTITVDNMKANGTDANAVQAIVTDAYGNVIPSATVAFSAGNGATVTTASATTDGNGVATTTLTNTMAGVSTVTAAIGNAHPTVDTHFLPDNGTATIVQGALTVTTDKAKANGSDTNAVKAIVTDANSNVVPGAVVEFSADNGATVTTASVTTDGNGVATTTLTNTSAGVSIVTAKINTTHLTVDTHFMPDGGTATIIAGALTVTKDKAKADGADTNAVKVVVKDANGNVVPGVPVDFGADNGATVTTATVTTDTNGEATTTLTNITSGVSIVTATVNSVSLTVDTHFIPDSGTATIIAGALTVTVDNMKANGTDDNAVKAVVKDANGNLVPGVNVDFSATNGATVTTAAVMTDANGEATTTLTNTTAGVSAVTAKVNNVSLAVDTHFVPDDSTATIIAGALTVTKDKAKADGADTNAVKVVVKDANGNVVPGVPVDFGADNGATVTTATVTTDTNGEATTTLTNITSGVSIVTATVNSVSLTVDTHFIPDSGTATIIAGALTVTVDNMKANGTDDNAVKAVVKDANGNLVPGVNVDFSATNGATVTTAAVMTDANGEATTTLTNTTAGVSTVKATVNRVSLTVDTHFLVSAASGNSTLTISKPRIVANNNVTGTDIATIKLVLKDDKNQPVTGIANHIEFVVVNTRSGNVVTSGITLGAIQAGSAAGEYTATIFGDSIDKFRIKVKIDGTDFGTLSTEISLFNYLFALDTKDKTIVEGGKYQFSINATASDNNQAAAVTSGTTWTIADTSFATIDTTGTALGVLEGVTTVNAQGVYQGLPYTLDAKLTVKGPIYSPDYGETVAGDTTNDYVIEPPSYSIAMRCAWIVDAMGTKENITGGTGGNALIINNLDKVKSIDISTGNFSSEPGNRSITQLKFKMDGGSVETCGENKGTSNLNTETFTIPTGTVLQGYEVSGKKYIHKVKFIVMPKV